MLETLESGGQRFPAESGWTHIQFRRFADCPICNLHLQEFIRRAEALSAKGIAEWVVFHSEPHLLLKHHATAPFPLVADPGKRLYREFGVERSFRAFLNLRAWRAALKGAVSKGVGLPALGESPLGLPADFLLGPEGRIEAVKYGRHADDQWTFDEVLVLARNARSQAMCFNSAAG